MDAAAMEFCSRSAAFTARAAAARMAIMACIGVSPLCIPPSSVITPWTRPSRMVDAGRTMVRPSRVAAPPASGEPSAASSSSTSGVATTWGLPIMSTLEARSSPPR